VQDAVQEEPEDYHTEDDERFAEQDPISDGAARVQHLDSLFRVLGRS
jgi:hypothetical protein